MGDKFEEFEKGVEVPKKSTSKFELIVGGITIIALLLNLFLIPGSAVFTILSLATLSCFYFYFSFAILNSVRLRMIFKKGSFSKITTLRIIGAIGVGVNLSVVLLGILFKTLSWPGASVMLMSGLLGLSGSLVVMFVKYSQNKSSFYVNVFKRIVLVGGLGAFLFFLPKDALLEFKYRDSPDYITAVKAVNADPENEVLQRNVVELRRKMDEEGE
ncbi:MAG: hypothetical protein HRT69_11005 [Flavobacteriaceae bacterium]|nr:hypothetical protein [Flavobacteriaceae bacterium]